MINASAVISRNEELVSAPVGEELAMMDIDTGTYYLLDDIGTFIWSRLAGPIPVADLLATVQEHYDVTPEQCEADVLTLLGEMHEKDLVQVGA